MGSGQARLHFDGTDRWSSGATGLRPCQRRTQARRCSPRAALLVWQTLDVCCRPGGEEKAARERSPAYCDANENRVRPMMSLLRRENVMRRTALHLHRPSRAFTQHSARRDCSERPVILLLALSPRRLPISRCADEPMSPRAAA